MWLVSQPNSVILEVKVEPNSIGQQCLEKVSDQYVYYLIRSDEAVSKKSSFHMLLFTSLQMTCIVYNLFIT